MKQTGRCLAGLAGARCVVVDVYVFAPANDER